MKGALFFFTANAGYTLFRKADICVLIGVEKCELHKIGVENSQRDFLHFSVIRWFFGSKNDKKAELKPVFEGFSIKT